MEYLTPSLFGKQLNPPISGRRVRVLCEEGRVPGALKVKSRIQENWIIPSDAFVPRKLKNSRKSVPSVDIFSSTPSVFRSMSPDGQAEYIEEAFLHYRKNGFPYLNLSEDQLLRKSYSMIKYIPKIKGGILSHNPLGLDLCEHFMPHIYEAKRYDRRSPLDNFYDDERFRKILKTRFNNADKFNDASVRRGFKLVGGGVSNFKPTIAKYVYQTYGRDGGRVYDFSAGYGGRLLGFLSSGIGGEYVGIEPFCKSVEGLRRLASYWSGIDSKPLVKIIQGCAEDFQVGSFDLAFSSPPYFDLERYSLDESQSINRYPTYSCWIEGFLNKIFENCFKMLKPGGFFVYVIGNYSDVDLEGDARMIAGKMGFVLEAEVKVPLMNLFNQKTGIYKYEILSVFRKP